MPSYQQRIARKQDSARRTWWAYRSVRLTMAMLEEHLDDPAERWRHLQQALTEAMAEAKLAAGFHEQALKETLAMEQRRLREEDED
jgi:hypothetical protein